MRRFTTTSSTIFQNLVVAFPMEFSSFMGMPRSTTTRSMVYMMELWSAATPRARKSRTILFTQIAVVRCSSGLPVHSNNLTDGTNPLFVDAQAANFQLQPGSRAIDAGTSLSAVTTDFTGGRRPEGNAVDIGAYEYRPAQSSPVPPAPSGLRIVAN